MATFGSNLGRYIATLTHTCIYFSLTYWKVTGWYLDQAADVSFPICSNSFTIPPLNVTFRLLQAPHSPPPHNLHTLRTKTNCGHKRGLQDLCRCSRVVLHPHGCEPKGARKMLNAACKVFMVGTNVLRMLYGMELLKSVGRFVQNCRIKKSSVQCTAVTCPNIKGT
jgi:hypothetical protein